MRAFISERTDRPFAAQAIMDTMELAAAFERDGFVVIDNFFAHDLMEELDRLIREHFGDDPDFLHSGEFLGRSKTDVIPWFPQNDGTSPFNQIDKDARLAELTGAILGNGWQSQYCMVMFSKQGTTGQAWHQDCAPDNPSLFNLNRLVYTRDITADIGGQTVVVPGSHRQGLLPAGNPLGEFDGQVVLRPKKGTLVLIHGHVWHRVLPIMGAHRFSANYRAAPAGTPDDITDICIYRNMRYRFSTSEVVEERVFC